MDASTVSATAATIDNVESRNIFTTAVKPDASLPSPSEEVLEVADTVTHDSFTAIAMIRAAIDTKRVMEALSKSASSSRRISATAIHSSPNLPSIPEVQHR
ncbi:MAG TPA: hypothetical protein VJ867_10310 [Gemmatimonadaceae bacterium]|nr:hypothetical protein [Gemmatimonadaceae bacterium]